MKNRFIVATVLTFFALSIGQAGATDFSVLGGNMNVNLLVNTTSVSLIDSLDSIYLGTLKAGSSFGFGGEAALFYPFAPGIKAGPHFIFNYSPLASDWHDFQLFQTSLGGIVDFSFDGRNSVSAFIDYNLGWFNAQQEIASVSGLPAPAGNFSGGIPGLMFGVKTCTKLSEAMGLGLYYQMGTLNLAGIKYKNNSNQNAWMDAGINFSQFGAIVYF
ncbi:MAG: hypothetical protein WCW67_05910 [Candidatus Margulisiibacteriota bacterium]|jgi:hypothetical protein